MGGYLVYEAERLLEGGKGILKCCVGVWGGQGGLEPVEQGDEDVDACAGEEV